MKPVRLKNPSVTRNSTFSLFLLPLALLIATPGCTDHPCDKGEFDPLIGHWIVSDEPTGESGEWIYRRNDSGLVPLSRFRSQFIFSEDGTCRFLALSPIDAHYWIEGRWRRDEVEQSIVHVSSPDQSFSFQILENDESILRILEPV